MHVPSLLHVTRRQFLGRAATGVGSAALAMLMNPRIFAAQGIAGLPHFAPKAKRVIYLLQNGAPSHVDLFDYKPKLKEWHGKEIPAEIRKGKRLSTMTSGQSAKPVLGEITTFAQHGKSGAWVSDFLPRTAEIADELCFIKSMHTEAVNHAPAITFFLTGGEIPGRPSMGAWLTYGLGTDSQNLPSYVVMTSRDKEASCGQIFYDFYWGSGFLQSKFQGVKFRGSGDPVLYLSNPDGLSREMRRGILDDITKMNEIKLKEFGDPEIATRISQYEMAYRMQASVPELTDFSKEPASVLEMYGPDVKRQGSYVVWDDHEFENNLDPEAISPAKLTAAKGSFYEALPMEPGPTGALWQSFRWGNTAEVIVLDCRTERIPSTLGTGDQVYMSAEQRAFLKQTLKDSPCHFKIVLNSVPMTKFPDTFWANKGDRWQGYTTSRDEILNHLETEAIDNVWFISGDLHTGFVCRLEQEGFRRTLFDVAVGPGGMQGNPLSGLAEMDPQLREEIFPSDQFFYFGDNLAMTYLTLDPLRDVVRIRFVDAETRETLFDRELSRNT